LDALRQARRSCVGGEIFSRSRRYRDKSGDDRLANLPVAGTVAQDEGRVLSAIQASHQYLGLYRHVRAVLQQLVNQFSSIRMDGRENTRFAREVRLREDLTGEERVGLAFVARAQVGNEARVVRARASRNGKRKAPTLGVRPSRLSVRLRVFGHSGSVMGLERGCSVG
jgi:hypothetical protein